MADFCTFCSKEMGLPSPDIDIPTLFNSLEEGFFIPCLCEGCGMIGVSKIESKPHIIFIEGAEPTNVMPIIGTKTINENIFYELDITKL